MVSTRLNYTEKDLLEYRYELLQKIQKEITATLLQSNFISLMSSYEEPVAICTRISMKNENFGQITLEVNCPSDCKTSPSCTCKATCISYNTYCDTFEERCPCP